MKNWICTIVSFNFIFWPSLANAQFDLGRALDNGPVDFGGRYHVHLEPFGSKLVTASASANFILNNVQALLDAALPQIKEQAGCSYSEIRSAGLRNAKRVTIDSITFSSGSPLILVAKLHVVSCLLLYSGDITITAPIAIVRQSNAIMFKVSDVSIAQGVRYADYQPVSDDEVIPATRAKVGPFLLNSVKRLNNWVSSKFHDPSVQKLIQQHHLQIQNYDIAIQNGDLILSVGISGQISVQSANKLVPF